MKNIDWSVFDEFPESYVTCKCDASFKSHAKLVKLEDGFRLCTRKPCPACGKSDNLKRSSSPWESMVVRENDVREIRNGDLK